MKVLDNMKYQRFMRFVLLASMIGVFTDGLDTTALSAAPFSLIPNLHLTTTQFGLLASILYVGGIPGALSFGYIADIIGRKNTFIMTLVIMTIFEFISAFATSFTQLLVLRLIIGFAVGADFGNAPLYFNEFSSKATRGRNYMMFFVFSGLGLMSTGVLAYLMFPLQGLEWRLLYIVTCIPPAIGIFLRLRLPESPRFLVQRNDIEGAKAVYSHAGLDPDSVGEIIIPQKIAVRTKYQLMRPYILGTAIPLFLIGIFINIPLTSVGLLSTLYFGLLGIKPPVTALFGIASFTLPITLGALVGSRLIEKLGRRVMMLIASGVGFVLIFIMGQLAHSSTAYILLGVQAVAAVLIWFATPIIYNISTELYPTAIRGTGEGITVAGTRVAGYFGPYVGTILLTTYSLSAVFIFDAVMLLFMFVIVLVWAGKKVDTTGVEIEDVVKKFEGVA